VGTINHPSGLCAESITQHSGSVETITHPQGLGTEAITKPSQRKPRINTIKGMKHEEIPKMGISPSSIRITDESETAPKRQGVIGSRRPRNVLEE
jgi:hypothetical protein